MKLERIPIQPNRDALQNERSASRRLIGEHLGGLPQVGDEVTIFARLVGLVLDPQQERRVDGDEGGGAVAQPVWVPAHLADGDDLPEQAARRGGAERHARARAAGSGSGRTWRWGGSGGPITT